MTEIIYDSRRSELENFLFKLTILEEQGVSVGQMPDAVFDRLKEVIENDDRRKLEVVERKLYSICQTV